MKKLSILFIVTFIIAMVFFSGYLVIQEVRGAIGLSNSIDMQANQIKNLKNSYTTGIQTSSPVTKNQMSCFSEVRGIVFRDDTALRVGLGLGKFSVKNWCEINDFSYCTDSFEPDETYGCFTSQTPILMTGSSYKPIKDVREGDWILTKENENSDKMVSAKVAKTFEHTIDSYYRIINHKLEVTDIHPVFVNGVWKQAWTIKLGDKLLNEKGEEVVVESLKLKRAKIKVYNLEIKGYETYFANGFYVHNKPVEGDEPLLP